jgi:hypothetical protein
MSAAVVHRISAQAAPAPVPRWEEDVDPALSLYRPRTLGLLRRYLQQASAVGRLPSLVAQEGFRARVTCYRMTTFEDAVIFVLDMERALERLDGADQQIISGIILQGHSHDAAARFYHCTRRTVTRRLCVALDHLSEGLLASGLLKAL